MSDRSKKISELNALTANTVANNDLFVVVDTSATETKSISAGNLGQFVYRTANVPGPYANNAEAASAGIIVGRIYYDTDGVVRIRMP